MTNASQVQGNRATDNDTYVERLKELLWEAESNLKGKEAAVKSTKSIFGNANEYYQEITGYWNAFWNTNDLAKNAIQVITNNLELTLSIARSAGYSQLAVQHLVINAEAITEQLEVLKSKAEELMQAVEGAKLSPESSGMITQTIKELTTLIGESVNASVLSITETLEAYQLNRVLYEQLGTCELPQPDDQGNVQYPPADCTKDPKGLLKRLCDLLALIQRDGNNAGEIRFPRTDDCHKEDYYRVMKAEAANAEGERNQALLNYQAALKEQRLSLSQRDALKKSLEAAKKAAVC